MAGTEFMKAYNSFSGADIRAVMVIPMHDATLAEPDVRVEILGSLQTLSYSVFREKVPVRALGQANERGKTRGTRTIAGSLVFTTFDRNAFFNILTVKKGDTGSSGAASRNNATWSQRMPDQLPPFDIIVNFANEYKHTAQLILYGVELISQGQVMSIENLITEATYQFTAGDLAVMRPGEYAVGAEKKMKGKLGMTGAEALNAHLKEKRKVASRNLFSRD